MKEIRTSTGKLIGSLDEQSRIFQIRNGKKIIAINIPNEGLILKFKYNTELSKEIYIPFST